jgi:hypothetical protein
MILVKSLYMFRAGSVTQRNGQLGLSDAPEQFFLRFPNSVNGAKDVFHSASGLSFHELIAAPAFGPCKPLKTRTAEVGQHLPLVARTYVDERKQQFRERPRHVWRLNGGSDLRKSACN